MVGSGYVGLVTGTCLADIGHNVVCVDIDEAKVAKLKAGISPIYEPGLSAMIENNLAEKRIDFTTSLQDAMRGAEVVFIAVGTPEEEDGTADLQYVDAVAKSIGEFAEDSMLVVVKSTVPVGTCNLIEETICKELDRRQLSIRVSVASNPEFLKEGAAIADFMRPDRLVVGVCSAEDEKVIRQLYEPFLIDDSAKLLIMDRKSSELTKYGSNSMLATRISFMNELSQLCESLGANIDNVRRGMGADPRIGKKFLYAGPGYGGSCFPKDVAALLQTSDELGVDLQILRAVTAANSDQKDWVAAKIAKYFGELRGKKIAIWGLAFKPDTDDVRESPSKRVISYLLEKGARVVAHDPQAAPNFARDFGDNPHLSYVEDAYQALDDADALALMTEWNAYKRPDWLRVESLMSQRVIFDFRNQYDANALMETGFHYQAVGRPDSVVRHAIH